jgi:hypothetical protein
MTSHYSQHQQFVLRLLSFLFLLTVFVLIFVLVLALFRIIRERDRARDLVLLYSVVLHHNSSQGLGMVH